MSAEDSIARAIDRAVLASRCPDGAAEDVQATGGGQESETAADMLRDQALRAAQIAETIEGLRD
jgi:hypothetical protein